MFVFLLVRTLKCFANQHLVTYDVVMILLSFTEELHIRMAL